MAQGRQQSEWMQTLALVGRIANVLGRFDPRPFMPAHLRRGDRPEDEPTAAECADTWDMLRTAVEANWGRKGS